MINKEVLSRMTRGSSKDFIGEVFFDGLQLMLGEDIQDRLVIFCHGMNQRVKSKDVLSVDINAITAGREIKEFVQLNLARNGLYHQLPELLFHPLVVSSPGMSNKEVVDAIKANEEQERELVKFFAPFDTLFFKESYSILNRHLNLFSNPDSRKNLLKVIDCFVDKSINITDPEKYKLFRFLVNSEQYKENLPKLSYLIHEVLDIEVRLKYEISSMSVTEFACIGGCRLGFTAGLNGLMTTEIDNVSAVIMLTEKHANTESAERLTQVVTRILEYFILSSRKIEVTYNVEANFEFELGTKRLGYDTNL